jgi:hypothetical protein
VDDELLSWLQNWYAAQCDGDWEHQYGLTIETLDNPGWYVAINLAETPLEDTTFQPVDERYRSEDNWVDCRVVEGDAEGISVRDSVRGPKFRGAGGPHNLSEILHIFREWVIQQER